MHWGENEDSIDLLTMANRSHLDDSLKIELCAIPQGEFTTLGSSDAAPALRCPDQRVD